MSRRPLIIVIAAAGLIVGAIAIIFLVNRSPALQNKVLDLANINAANTNVQNINTAPANTNTVADPDKAAREYVARNFSESFGSGTSEDNYSNWAKTRPFVTASFGAFLDRTQTQQRQGNLSGPYHSYLTKALVVVTTKSASTTAAMTVSTQRQETIVTETKVYYQDLLLDLLKVGNDWKVNAATWRPL